MYMYSKYWYGACCIADIHARVPATQDDIPSLHEVFTPTSTPPKSPVLRAARTPSPSLREVTPEPEVPPPVDLSPVVVPEEPSPEPEIEEASGRSEERLPSEKQ